MTNEVTAPKTLQERVGERIKQQIGELMTDEDMKTLVERAMNEAFFTERITKDEYGRERSRTPPQIVVIVKDLLQERVEASAKAWLEQHKDEFAKQLDDTIGAGFSKLMVAWLDQKVNGALFQFGQNLQTQMGMHR